MKEKHPQHKRNGCEGGKCKFSQTKRAFRSNIYFHFCGNDAYMLMNIFNKMNSSRAHRSAAPLPQCTHTHTPSTVYYSHCRQNSEYVLLFGVAHLLFLMQKRQPQLQLHKEASIFIASMWCGTKANQHVTRIALAGRRANLSLRS